MFLDSLVNTLNKSIFRYEHVLAYLKNRGIESEDINQFKIGYSKIVSVPDDQSPDRARFMTDMWQGKKIENKIIFPFQDILGRVVGLIGRSIETKGFKIFALDEAKFTGFFFGLFQALPSIYETRTVYTVEGPFDHQAFCKVFPNTVATMTAGLNESQHDLLSMFCDKIVTVFDSDDPGREASDRAQDWGNVTSIDLGYKDPSECLARLGLDKFKKYAMKRVSEQNLFI